MLEGGLASGTAFHHLGSEIEVLDALGVFALLEGIGDGNGAVAS